MASSNGKKWPFLLFLFFIILILIIPAFKIWELAAVMRQVFLERENSFASIFPVIFVKTTCLILLITTSVAAGISLVKRKRHSLLLSRMLLYLHLLYALFVETHRYMESNSLGLPLSTSTLILRVCFSVFFVSFWLVYLNYSRRVKQFFVGMP